MVHILLCSTLSVVPVFASANEEVEKNANIMSVGKDIHPLKVIFIADSSFLEKWYPKVRWHEFLERPGDVINMLRDFSPELILCHH